MRPAAAFLLLIGVVVAVVGLLGVTGVVGIQVIGANGETVSHDGAIVAAFNYTTANLTLTALPHNQFPVLLCPVNNCPKQYVLVTWFWGDGKMTEVNGTSSAGVPHTYAAAGAYTVEDLAQVSYSTASTIYENSVSASVTVSGSTPNVGNGSVTTGGNNFQAYVAPSFTVSTNSLLVTTTDTSKGVNETISTVTWNWGDGSTTTGAPGQVSVHNYGAAGTYTINEIVRGGATAPAGVSGYQPGTYNVSHPVTVKNGTGPSPTSSTNPNLLGVKAGGFTPTATALLAFGVLLTVWELPFVPTSRVAPWIGLVVAFLAGLAGWVVAGGAF